MPRSGAQERKLVPAAVAVLVIAILVAAGCGREDAGASAVVAEPLPTTAPAVAPEVLAARGQVVEQATLSGFFDDPSRVIGEARRAVYRSVSGIDGGARQVSGVFLVPPGPPPPGGWRVISIGHGTTGIGADCAPSQDRELRGFWPMARSYLTERYAVAVTDYEGLGQAGRHPYLEPRTAAYNVIDGVRALRNLFPDVSEQWVAFGNSQGGQAVWAANEAAAQYGDGLHLAGSVALSPAANVTGLADLVRSHGLSTDQRTLWPLVADGLARYNPSLIDDGLVPRLSPEQESQAFSCTPDGERLREQLVPASGIQVDDERTAAILRAALRRIALPQAPLSAPLLVVNGLADETIPAPWVTAAVQDACRLGGQIEHIEVAGAGHGDLGAAAYAQASAWVRERFDGATAPSNCGREPETVSVG